MNEQKKHIWMEWHLSAGRFVTYARSVSELLKAEKAEEGDMIKVLTNGKEHVGILMPHHDFSDPDTVVLKLKSGYNIGVRLAEGSKVTVVRKVEKKGRHFKAKEIDPSKKNVAVIGTGGTIASYVDYRTGAVHPALSAEDLVATVPEMADICNVKARVLFSIFSENMDVQHWQELAGAVVDQLNSGDEGCIIPHGTDTMGYTSAALSFMLESLPRPVLLVGAQRSSDRPSSDAYTNLLASARFCVQSDAAEVFILMHHTSSDTVAAVHRGTRVRKMHTSRRDAFESVNEPPVALVDFEGGIKFNSAYRKKSSGKVAFKPDMEKEVALIHFYPGMSPEAFEKLMGSHNGVVISGSGLGHVSADMVKVLKRTVDNGIPVVMTSQCLYGSVNLNVYYTGRDLLTAGVIPGGDTLPETALIKLMWGLANTNGEEELRKVMVTNIRGELSDRREIDD